jgi:hypothetical protein
MPGLEEDTGQDKMSAFRWSGVPLLASALTAVAVIAAHAQQAWPGDNKPAQQQQAWPGDAKPAQPQQQPRQGWPGDAQPGQPQQTSASAPARQGWQQPGGSGAPQAWPQGGARQASAPAAAPLMMPQVAPAPGMGGAPQGGGGNNPCMAEFMRLRSDVEKRGASAKAVNDHKGSREELCAAVSGMYSAQATWVKYAKQNSSSCGIPPDIIKQLRMAEDHFAKLKKNICSAGPAAGPAAPSLSQALGTNDLPITADESAKKRGGVFDTLTGQMGR